MNRGRFIAIEGLEGAGKTTAIANITQYLDTINQPFIITREPGGTYVGETVRTLIKYPLINGEKLADSSELLLLYVARIQLISEVIKPRLAQGYWVISDRFEWSTFAYQGAGRQISNLFIEQLSSFCLSSFKPDLTIFLDIKPEEGLKRAKNRGRLDQIEQQPIDFFNRVYQAYQQLIKQKNTVIIDASKTEREVQQLIINQLRNYLKNDPEE